MSGFRGLAIAAGLMLFATESSAASDDRLPCQELSQSEAVFVGVARAPVKRWIRLPDHPLLEFTLTPIDVERAYVGVSTPVMYLTPLGVEAYAKAGVRYLVYGRHYHPPDIVMASPGFGAKEVESAAGDLAFLDGVGSGGGGIVAGLVHERPLTFDGTAPDGEPLADVRVRIVNDQYSTESVTGPDGRFNVTEIPPGRYALIPQLPDDLVVRDPTSTIEVVVRDGGCATETIDVVPNGRVRGILRDPDGRPLSFTSVDLLPMDVVPEPTTGQIRGTSSVSTNEHGEFEFAGRPAGRYYLGVSLYNAPNAFGPSYPRTYYPGSTDRASAEPVVIEPGKDSGLHDFSIPAILPKGELKVVVDGAPPDGAELCVAPLENLFKIRSLYRAHPGTTVTLPVVAGQPYEVHAHARYPGGHLESAPYVFTATTGTTWVRLRLDEPRTLHP
jgi:hypothetical protein